MKLVGRPMNSTRMYMTASGSESAGVFIATRIDSQNTAPATDIAIESTRKNVALVPTTRLASSSRFAPRYTPTRIVAAIDSPNTPPRIRNSTLFELVVAVSAASPRKWPTQNELMDAFSDWRTLPYKIGSANSRSPRPMDPSVRVWRCMGRRGRLAVRGLGVHRPAHPVPDSARLVPHQRRHAVRSQPAPSTVIAQPVHSGERP